MGRDLHFYPKAVAVVPSKGYFVWCESLHNFPDVYDDVTLSSSLERHELQGLESTPVVHVFVPTYFAGEDTLHIFQCLGVCYGVMWVPKWAAILEVAPDEALVES